MNLIDKLANWWVTRKGAGDESALLAASLLPGQRGRPLWSGNKAALIERYTEYTYACTARVSDAVAQTPLRAYYLRRPRQKLAHERLFHPEPVRRDRRKYLRQYRHLQKYTSGNGELMEVGDHPLLDLFAQANPEMDGYFLAKLVVIYLCLTGESYQWVQTDKGRDGVPIALWPLPSQWTRLAIDEDGQLVGYVYGRTQTDEIHYDRAEVIYHREPNPASILQGFARLAAVANADELYEQFNVHELALLGNNAEPGGVWETDQKLTPVQRKVLLRELERLHRGPKRAGRVAVADRGLKFKMTAVTPKELGYVKGRPATIEEMAAGYGVPLSLLRTENVNKANAEVGEQQFARWCIRPICTLLEQKYNQDLCPRFDERLFVAHDDPTPADRESLLADRTQMVDKILTRNEIREDMGMGPVEGGDTLYVASGSVALEFAGAPPAPPVAAPVPGEDEPEADDDEDGEGPDVSGGKSVRKAANGRREQRTEGLAAIREGFRAALTRLWSEQRAEVVALMGGDGKSAAKAIDPGEVADWLLEESEWAEKYAAATREWVAAASLRGGTATMANLPTTLAFNIDNPRIAEWLEREPFAFAVQSNAETARLLRATLTEGMNAADTHRQLVKRVDAIFGDKARAELITKTETAWAYEQGGLEGARQSGVVRAKLWRAHPTACEYCAAMDGVEIELDESFVEVGGRSRVTADGKSLACTYRDVDVAQLHPRCECWSEWVLLDEFTAE